VALTPTSRRLSVKSALWGDAAIVPRVREDLPCPILEAAPTLAGAYRSGGASGAVGMST
jgi:hypothetical protein